MIYDAIIIGKGPAGISASIYLARSGKSVLVIGKDEGALERSEKIENYYGFPEGIGGAELVGQGIAQAERFGVQLVCEEAVSLVMEDSFVVRTSGEATQGDSTGEYRGKTILLATGKSRTALRVPGFEELRGKGISFCATCDGFFYRGKKIALIGSGDYAAAEFGELLHFTKDITLLTNGAMQTSRNFPSDIQIVAGKITGFESTGEGDAKRLSGITIEGGTVLPVDGCFVALGTAGAAEFAAKMGIETSDGDIVVDGAFMTNMPGIFAGGDCIGGFLQVAKAVSDGALAAKAMISYLKKNA